MPPKKQEKTTVKIGQFEFKHPSHIPSYYDSLNKSNKTESKDSNNDSKLTQSEQAIYLKRIPICEYCKKAHSQNVHHIIARQNEGTKTYNNLVALCGTCHNMARPTKTGDFIPTDEFKNCIKRRSKDTEKALKEVLKFNKKKNNK